MRRFDCLKILAGLLADDALVICNLQDTTYEWQHLRPSDGNLLRQGMANVTPVAFGVAVSLPHRQVVALDGDGSMIMGLGMLTTLARYAPKNLLVFIFDNETYNSGGVMPSATAFGADFEAMAKGAGFPRATTVRDVDAFREAATRALGSGEGWLIVAKVDRSPEPVERPRVDGKESKYRFVRFVEQTEGKAILLADEQKSFT